ncbi:hypothetical protein ACOJBO_02495 [Rhizobium beringeri]
MSRLETDNLGGHLDARIRVAARAVGVAITVPTFNADAPHRGGHDPYPGRECAGWAHILQG